MPISLSCQTLCLTLDDQGRATSLIQLQDGVELLAAARHPVSLWELGLQRHAEYDDLLPPIELPDLEHDGSEWWINRNEYRADLVLDSNDAAAPELHEEGGAMTLCWSIPVPDGDVRLEVGIKGGDRDALRFTSRVEAPASWTVRFLCLPRLRGFGDLEAPDADRVLLPRNMGVLRRNPLADQTHYQGQYPSGSQWGQFVSWLHDTAGLYVGVQDGETHHTGIDVQYVEDDHPAPMHVERWFPEKDTPPWGTGEPAPIAERLQAGRDPAMQLSVRHWPSQSSSWESPYAVVLRGFHGTWYDAAAIHRQWATKQRWCRRGKLSEQPRHAASELDLWFNRYGFPPWETTPRPAWEFRDAMLRLREAFDQPFGVHWYHWHAFSWHTTYPTHAPVVEGFAEVVKELQAHDIVIMPYCQGRLLYQDRPGIETERDHAVVEANGQPYMEMYTKQDQWPLTLCPHDEWSQLQWHEAARLLWRHYGIEGVYYDQIAAMSPSLCYHRGHGHPLGGGNQTWAGYDQALARLEHMKQEDPSRFVATESFSDAYIDRFDLFLSFVPPLEDYVPLWPAVYSGYTTVMGRHTPDAVLKDPQLMALCQGEQLLFGGQLGWMDERILNHPESMAFLRDAAKLRAACRTWLQAGQLLAPLADAASDARLDLELPANLISGANAIRLDRPAVCHTVWRGPGSADGHLVMLLNEVQSPVSFKATLPGDVREIRRLGCAEFTTGSGRQLQLELAPLEIVAIFTD